MIGVMAANASARIGVNIILNGLKYIVKLKLVLQNGECRVADIAML